MRSADELLDRARGRQRREARLERRNDLRVVVHLEGRKRGSTPADPPRRAGLWWTLARRHWAQLERNRDACFWALSSTLHYPAQHTPQLPGDLLEVLLEAQHRADHAGGPRDEGEVLHLRW